MAPYTLPTSAITIAASASKYKNFMYPSVAITIEGSSKIIEKGALIENLTIDSSLEKADYAEFNIINILDWEADAEKGLSTKSLGIELGKKIEIEIGYEETRKVVFKGYITSINYTFNMQEGRFIAHIGSMDKRFYMMRSAKSNYWKDSKHSDVVKNIATEYGLSPEVTDTESQYKQVGQKHVSDYDFLQEIALHNNYECFLAGDKLVFRKLHATKSSLLELNLLEDVLEMDITFDIAHQITAVKVTNWDPEKKETKAIEVKAITKVNDTGKDAIAHVTGTLGSARIYNMENAGQNEAEGKSFATGWLNRQAMKFCRGTLEIIGIPDIQPGIYMTLKGGDTTINQLYYIIGAKHTVSNGDYRTLLTIGGNTL